MKKGTAMLKSKEEKKKICCVMDCGGIDEEYRVQGYT